MASFSKATCPSRPSPARQSRSTKSEFFRSRVEKDEDRYIAKKALDAAKADLFREERREVEDRHRQAVFLCNAYAFKADVTQMVISNREVGAGNFVIISRYHEMVNQRFDEKIKKKNHHVQYSS